MDEIFVEKFGGASVNDANAVKNVVSILKKEKKKRIIVFSAMGKTTNALEEVVNYYFETKTINNKVLDRIISFHYNILYELLQYPSPEKLLDELFNEIPKLLENNKDSKYNKLYDAIVVYGELLSTKIISIYFNSIGFIHKPIDARNLIYTNDNFRNADINWRITNNKILDLRNDYFKEYDTLITQGFIGYDNNNNNSTTLGREGSDFSAAILAHCINAKSVIIWKDVPGLLNADPKQYENTIKFETIPFREAIELSYYGASIIHPKTIKPLENKNIPLFVKSFINYNEKGTIICTCNDIYPIIPSYIFKDNQTLVSIFPKDFSFIAEENIANIFSLFARYGIKINLMQNSAISYSVCFDMIPNNLLKNLIKELSPSYSIKYNNNLRLITIRRYNEEAINNLIQDKEIIIEQRSRLTAQFLIRL